jgi:hypothetical protein
VLSRARPVDGIKSHMEAESSTCGIHPPQRGTGQGTRPRAWAWAWAWAWACGDGHTRDVGLARWAGSGWLAGSLSLGDGLMGLLS